jgi:hypothetical protein
MRSLTILGAGLLAAAATQAPAQDVKGVAQIDWNGDSFVNFTELAIAYPGIDRESFAEIDTNGDNRLDQTELYEIPAQDILARYEDTGRTVRIPADRDGDGFASFEELTAIFPGFTQSDFETIDTNDDNRIDTVEFYELEAQDALARYPMDGASLEDVDVLDTNGDRFVSFEEISAAYPGLPQVDFDEMDTNDDNQLDFTELYALDAQMAIARHQP